jgi:adenine-specific DNA-methyltransferase
VIKYLGSKRRLVPVLSEICRASGARTALDLFTGTTRVAQAFKAQGVHVTAADSARYAHAFARTYIEADATAADMGALRAAVTHLNGLPGKPGYVTEEFSRQARFFQPHNAARIDAVRDAIDSEYAGSPLFPLLLTSLIEAADRVDSTTGVQMAYVKQWAPRSFNPLELRVPELLAGPGRAIQGDAVALAGSPALGHVDLAYLDPPYNQHRYFTNYHVWETLVAWDSPEAYGVARKRVDARDPSTHSVFNSKRSMPAALASVVQSVDCDLLVLSYNNESWLGLDELEAMCAVALPPSRDAGGGTARTARIAPNAPNAPYAPSRGPSQREVATLAFDSTRYVGARIGIFNPSGRKVGRVSHLSNQELLVIAGEAALVHHVLEAVGSTPAAGSATAAGAAAGVATVSAAVVAPSMADRLQQAT